MASPGSPSPRPHAHAPSSVTPRPKAGSSSSNGPAAAYDTPRAPSALRRAASSPTACSSPSPLPRLRRLDASTPPARSTPALDPFQAPFVPSSTLGCGPARVSSVPVPASSHDRLDAPESPIKSAASHAEDPVAALGGRSTPFFMIPPQDQVCTASDEMEEAEWLDAALGWDGVYEREGPLAGRPPRAEDERALHTLSGAREGLTGFAQNLHGRKVGSASKVTGNEADDEADDEVNPQERADSGLVAALASRLDSLTALASDLYHRVRVLEEAALVRDGAVFADPLRSPDPPQLRSAVPPFPSHFPHAFPDGSYWPASSPAQRNEDLTPPASPQLSRQSSYALSHGCPSSGASMSVVVPRERAISLEHMQFTPLDAPYFPPPALAYPQAGHGDAAATYTTPGTLGELYGGARERSVSMAQLPSSFVSSGIAGSGDAMGMQQNAFRHRSISLGEPFQPRSQIPPRAFEIPNYRVLLETDADIDHEAFVRRTLRPDQQCSLFLQQRVKSTTPEKRQDLFAAVGRHVLDLSLSKFGNFLVSRCLEAGDSALAQAYEDALAGHFLQLSLDSFGCHVVQKLLDCGGPATKERIVDELLPHSHVLTTKSSLHVINRILTTPNPPAFFHRLASTGKGLWASIVKDDGGSLVVQHMLEDWPEAGASVVAREILDRLDEVARTACGSFVAANLLDRNPVPFVAKLMKHAPQLAADPFGAKLVDKCLRTNRAGPAGIGAFIAAITTANGAEPPLLLRIATHAHGAQLVANLLSGPHASPRDKDQLARAALALEGTLLRAGTGEGAGAHGARVVGMCRKALGA